VWFRTDMLSVIRHYSFPAGFQELKFGNPVGLIVVTCNPKNLLSAICTIAVSLDYWC